MRRIVNELFVVSYNVKEAMVSLSSPLPDIIIN